MTFQFFTINTAVPIIPVQLTDQPPYRDRCVRKLPWINITDFNPIVVPLIEGSAKLFGKEPLVTMDEAREVLGRYPTFDSSPTEEALGVEFRGLEECVDHALRWLLHMGALPPKVAERMGAEFPPDREWRAVA